MTHPTTEQNILKEKRLIKKKWRKEKIPCCTNGRNHKWKGGSEIAICLICGFDALDNCYRGIP